ncbi:unnamed protein product [Prunus armeniaca]|uniref:Uncharacterized protein n=1 Tax=Prunus armeniaca TaxID=36596 RepID=A0A6J5WNZ1_PRUAR|nr:unnamed protein product [Prunus armeniaca]CAB4301717.1 unnamed protein product [Prunus armeniaca]
MENASKELEFIFCLPEGTRDLFNEALYSPFCISVCSGTLDVGDYKQYMAEEAFILNAVAEGYTTAQQYASEADSHVLAALGDQIKYEIESRKKNLEVCDLELNGTLHKAAESYTELLLDTAKSGKNAMFLSLVSSWMGLYKALSGHFKLMDLPHNNPYCYSWINMHESENFVDFGLETDYIFSRSWSWSALSNPNEDLEIVRNYRRGMELTIEFFYAQASHIRTALPLISGERKTKFSINVELGCVLFPRRSYTSYKEGLISIEDDEQYQRCLAIMFPAISVEFSYGKVEQAYFNHFSSYRRKTTEKLDGSRDLVGIRRGAMTTAFRKSVSIYSWFRKIYPEMLNLRGDSGYIRVYSSCYCLDVIRGVFEAADFPNLTIYAGEHTVNKGITTGKVVSRWSAIDMAKMVEIEGDDHCFTICIGREMEDLPCLLKADLGIIVDNGAIDVSVLQDLGERFGVKFEDLFMGVMLRQQELCGGGSPKWYGHGTIYVACGWDELYAFLKALKKP